MPKQKRIRKRSTGKTVHAYSADKPIRKQAEDRFHRWPFAERIAETLATTKDPASLVIGLYGPWGDGKTSTLYLMEEALARYKNVVVVHFNPWLFQSEEQLLRGFFATLADALKQSLHTKAESIGKALNKYGSILSLASVSLAGVVQVGLGEAATGLGKALSTVDLDDLRKRVELFLQQSGKRVAILIDDIDRLDRSETQAILKLVKLSAGFSHTSYVLAFDDEMVAAAIGEKYAQGGVDAGRSFLEKIIQVPLHLPPPSEIALRTVTFEGIVAAINHSGIEVSQEQWEQFVHHFINGIEPQLQTPRHAKLYVNALTFALPLLKGEANPVEVMLVEGVRIFFPKLFAAIRDNPDYFLKGAGGGHPQNEHLKRIDDTINTALDGTGVQDKDRVRQRLLEVLFPRLANMQYGPEWENEWAKEKRICSNRYFRRYFTYGIPPGDVSDVEVSGLIAQFSQMTAAEADTAIHRFGKRKALGEFIRKLRELQSHIDAAAASVLVLAVARNGSILPREGGMHSTDATFMQAGILVADLLRRMPAGAEREELAYQVFNQVEPLGFGTECLRWAQHHESQPAEERIISEAAEQKGARLLADRIQKKANEAPLYQAFERDASTLYWLWNKHGDANALEIHLRRRFKTHPGDVQAFLRAFTGRSWEMTTGKPVRTDFRRDAYNLATTLIHADVIASALRQQYGAELDSPQFRHDSQISIERVIAHQFMYIHNHVQQENVQGSAPSQGQPPS